MMPARTREEKKLRAHLVKVTSAVKLHLSCLDGEMKLPSTPERGKRIAALCNSLEMANDQARYFGLGVDFRKDRKLRAEPLLGTTSRSR